MTELINRRDRMGMERRILELLIAYLDKLAAKAEERPAKDEFERQVTRAYIDELARKKKAFREGITFIDKNR